MLPTYGDGHALVPTKIVDTLDVKVQLLPVGDCVVVLLVPLVELAVQLLTLGAGFDVLQYEQAPLVQLV